MFDPVRICEILNEELVDYVLVGGFATVIHGSPLPTRDIDIVRHAHRTISVASHVRSPA